MSTLVISRGRCLSRRRLGYPTSRMSSAGFAVSPFISLRGIPQPSAQAKEFARNLRLLTDSAQGAAGVSRSEIKEECGRSLQGDIREGSRPLALGSATNARAARGETKWAN